MMNQLDKKTLEKVTYHLRELFKLSGFDHEKMSEELTGIIQNKPKEKLKQVWVMITEDSEGNEGVLAQPAIMLGFDGQPTVGGKPEVSPYEHDLEIMQERIKRLQIILEPFGLNVKLKKFTYVDMSIKIMIWIWSYITVICFSLFNPNADRDLQKYWQNRFFFCLTMITILVISKSFL